MDILSKKTVTFLEQCSLCRLSRAAWRGSSGNHTALWLPVFTSHQIWFWILTWFFPQLHSHHKQLSSLDVSSSLMLQTRCICSWWRLCCHVGYPLLLRECRLSSCVPVLLPHALSHFLHCPLGRKKRYFPQWTGEGQLVKRCLPCCSLLDYCTVRALIKVQELDSGCLVLCSHHLFWLWA